MATFTLNQFEINIGALAPASGRVRRTVPDQPMPSEGASQALSEAVDAAKAVLESHGFEISNTGYGVRGIGNFDDE